MLLCRLCHEHSAVDANDIHEEKDASEVGKENEKPCLENVEEACSSLKECNAGVLRHGQRKLKPSKSGRDLQRQYWSITRRQSKR